MRPETVRVRRCQGISRNLTFFFVYPVHALCAAVRARRGEGFARHFQARYSIYSLYWYKSTNTDAEGAVTGRKDAAANKWELYADAAQREYLYNKEVLPPRNICIIYMYICMLYAYYVCIYYIYIIYFMLYIYYTCINLYY